MYFELTEENLLNYLCKDRAKSMKLRDKYTELENGELVALVPDTLECQIEFYEDWRPMCIGLTEKRIKSFIRSIKVRAFFQGRRATSQDISLMLTRFIAEIMIEQTEALIDLSIRGDKAIGCENKPGFTYLKEIIYVMKGALIGTNETKADKEIVDRFDDLRKKH